MHGVCAWGVGWGWGVGGGGWGVTGSHATTHPATPNAHATHYGWPAIQPASHADASALGLCVCDARSFIPAHTHSFVRTHKRL
jgi:hypothetical protein